MTGRHGETVTFANRYGVTAVQRAMYTGTRLTIGVFFVGAGLAKLTRSPLRGIPPGIEGFARYLAAAGVPFALAGAWAVCVAEIGAGVGLAAGSISRRARTATPVFAGVLATEMLVAMALVGIPTARGRPVVLDGLPVTAEAYRLPLELGLFLALLYLAVGARSVR